MAVIINHKTRFATEGARFQRNNPDGTIPTPQRFVGFSGTADLSRALTAKKGSLTIKIDAGAPVTKEVDFTAAADLARVTVAQAVTALAAAFPAAAAPNAAFTQDPSTGRLKGSCTGNGKIIQVLGPLAAALDFGRGIKHGGNGLEVIHFFNDETISVGLPKDIKDKEEIDLESAKGTVTRMIIGPAIQGMSPVVTLKEKDYFFLELVQGGRLDRQAGAYDPPLSDESEPPTFWGEMFSPVYSRGSNKLSDVSGYERIFWRSMIGMEGDVPVDAKDWAKYAYNLTAPEYTDHEGARFPAWQEQTLTLEAFDALRVKQVKAA